MTPASYGPFTANGIYPTGKSNGVTTTLFISGIWDGASVEVYASPDGATYYPTGAVFTGDICRPVGLNPDIYLGVTVTNVGASTSLTVKRV